MDLYILLSFFFTNFFSEQRAHIKIKHSYVVLSMIQISAWRGIIGWQRWFVHVCNFLVCCILLIKSPTWAIVEFSQSKYKFWLCISMQCMQCAILLGKSVSLSSAGIASEQNGHILAFFDDLYSDIILVLKPHQRRYKISTGTLLVGR